jgi:hypothetical protein
MARVVLPAAVYACVAALALVWRLLAMPWDFGGCFFQVWVSAVGLGFWVAFYPRLDGRSRGIAVLTILPLAAFAVWGSLYFAPQALFPFLFTAFVIGGALFRWSRARTWQAIAVSLLLVPLAAYCFYGARHIRMIMRLRALQPDDVAELRLSPRAGARTASVVGAREALAIIVPSLRATTPYSPNHETIRQPWRLTIALRDGSSVALDLGDGNRAHPAFVWVQFGVAVYQNPELGEAFARAGVLPWH